jgi:hypothetical protein
MKLLLALAMFFLSGCVTPIDANGQQTCALQGMTLQSSQVSNGSAVAYSPNGTYAQGTSQGVAYTCAKPANEIEKCEAKAYEESLRPVNAFNSSAGGKNVVIGIGYLFYFFPGLAAYVVYEQDRTQSINESLALQRNATSCAQNPIAH